MILLLLLSLAATATAQNATQLWTRGYSVIPEPRNVRLTGQDVTVDSTWAIDATAIRRGHIAERTLVADLDAFHHAKLATGARERNVIRLAVAAHTVATGADAVLDAQAYRLAVEDGRVTVTGNSDQGLFYGVQTLLQLFKRDSAGRLIAPACVIEDWPKLQLRFLHWDTKHHQDRMETIRQYLDWSARMKVNMIAFELEDKFTYPSHPVIGAPGAFTPAELQQIVDYGLERFVQVVPDIQSPAHMSYVLKHPEFAHLRADGSNYQSALCDPRTYDLIFSMYDDVIKATRGVDYLYVSTDEVYYAGIEGTCRPYNPENRSLAWVEFVRKARDFAASRGRRILIWAEYPLLAKHVSMIPPDVIDGVIGEAGFIPIENKLGMRQLAYVSMQGEERLFPDNLSLDGTTRGRVAEAMETIAHGRHWQANPIGVFGAAWGDAGLHSETFWLGWSAVAQAGWNPGAVSPDQHVAEFMRLYYGPHASGMTEVYRAMQRQARAWERSWDRVISRVRPAAYGDSRGKGIGGKRYDLTLAAPPLPKLPDLAFTPASPRAIEAIRQQAAENEQLVSAIEEQLGAVERNRYNLEVFLSLARLMGHQWRLLLALNTAGRSLEQAQSAARSNDAAGALRSLIAAKTLVDRTHEEGESTMRDLTTVWEKSRFPKNRAVGGREFVYIQDDVKDHFADRTRDLSYMIAPERSIGLDAWSKALGAVIAGYAQQHKLDPAHLPALSEEED